MISRNLILPQRLYSLLVVNQNTLTTTKPHTVTIITIMISIKVSVMIIIRMSVMIVFRKLIMIAIRMSMYLLISYYTNPCMAKLITSYLETLSYLSKMDIGNMHALPLTPDSLIFSNIVCIGTMRASTGNGQLDLISTLANRGV